MTDLPTSPHLATSDDVVGDAAYPIASRFRLADGRLVWLRPLLVEDAPRLMDLCKRLSPSTLRRRFLRSVVRCDPLEAQRLAAVDQVQRVALVAVPDPADDPPIVAVGRFHGDGSEQAELALLWMMPISTSDWGGSCLAASFAKPCSGVCACWRVTCCTTTSRCCDFCEPSGSRSRFTGMAVTC